MTEDAAHHFPAPSLFPPSRSSRSIQFSSCLPACLPASLSACLPPHYNSSAFFHFSLSQIPSHGTSSHSFSCLLGFPTRKFVGAIGDGIPTTGGRGDRGAGQLDGPLGFQFRQATRSCLAVWPWRSAGFHKSPGLVGCEIATGIGNCGHGSVWTRGICLLACAPVAEKMTAPAGFPGQHRLHFGRHCLAWGELLLFCRLHTRD